MKQELAGLPLNEQRERLRPQRPLQYSVQFQKENNEQSNGDEKGHIVLITGSKDGSRIRIESDRSQERGANWAQGTGIIGGKYTCIITGYDDSFDFYLAQTKATPNQLKKTNLEVVFGARVREDDIVATQGADEEEGSETEGTRSGSVEEQTSQTKPKILVANPKRMTSSRLNTTWTNMNSSPPSIVKTKNLH